MTEIKRQTVSIKEAAAILGLGRSSIYKLINTGKINPVRIGRRVLIRIEDLKKLIEQAVEEQA